MGLRPASGAALSVALLTHVGTGCIGLTIDTASVPDPDVLAACVRASFAEVIAVGEGGGWGDRHGPPEPLDAEFPTSGTTSATCTSPGSRSSRGRRPSPRI